MVAMQSINESMLKKPITVVKGVGESRNKLLNSISIFTVEDLLHHFPRQYEDRRRIKKISELEEGDSCSVIAAVMSKVSESRPRRNLSIQKLQIRDETGIASVTWFNRTFLKQTFYPGQKYVFYGKASRRGLFIELLNPAYEKFEEHQPDTKLKMLPIYPLTAGLTQNIMRSTISDAFRLAGKELGEFLPYWMLKEHDLLDFRTAIQSIHFPDDDKLLQTARRRLVFQELLILQLGLLSIKSTVNEGKQGITFREAPQIEDFIRGLPFTLTKAQRKVYEEIRRDMESDKIMNRLIQGDVGSGKTVVALLAILKAYYSGYQAVMMAPTEILAEQHYNTINKMLEGRDIRVALLTGSTTAKERSVILEDLSSGSIDIIVGTHALIQDEVTYNNIGLAVTDEQHRFGVRQRAALKSKGISPDVIVMTATPIPRTLALILYGDLDISTIDEMPPGRKKIKTYCVNESMRERINEFVRKLVREGRQVFIVCPLVEESEQIEANSAVETAERISKEDFRDLKVELIHGRMKAAQKDRVIKEFVSGEIDILVSTTVIEEGIDVPNAALMIIENAERFGLAQLHQLRGRVGRGVHQSYCILYNTSDSQIAKERMKVMESSNDGFVISARDLELRGPGEFFGTRQHGVPELAIANLYSDIEILKEVQVAADYLLKDEDPLHSEENRKLLLYVQHKTSKDMEKLSL